HGREAVVAEEVGPGAPPVQHFPGDLVDVEGGRPGAGGLGALLVHLGHHPPGLAHEGDLSRGLAGDHRGGRGAERRSWRAGSTASRIRSNTWSGSPSPSTVTSSPIPA